MEKNRPSFKDVVTRVESVIEDPVQEKRLTYEEMMSVLKDIRDNESKKGPMTKSNKDVIEYLDEQSDKLHGLIDNMKVLFGHKGFCNNMSYSHVYKIIRPNMTVDEISNDNDENDYSFDEEEFHY